MRRPGRRKPYSEAEIARTPCACCGAPAVHQWQACADARIYRPICSVCDVAINLLALAATADPKAGTKIRAYCRALGVNYDDVQHRARFMAQSALELATHLLAHP